MSGRPSFLFDYHSDDWAELTRRALIRGSRLYGIPEYALHDVERIAAQSGLDLKIEYSNGGWSAVASIPPGSP